MFQERALDCYNLVSEETLVSICLLAMSEEYHIHLDNLIFTSFPMLTKPMRATNRSMKKALKHNSVTRYRARKWPSIATFKRVKCFELLAKRSKPVRTGIVPMNRTSYSFPPFHYGARRHLHCSNMVEWSCHPFAWTTCITTTKE